MHTLKKITADSIKVLARACPDIGYLVQRERPQNSAGIGLGKWGHFLCSSLSSSEMLSLASRRRCFNVLVVMLVICSAVLFGMLYSYENKFTAMHHELFSTQYTNHSRRHDAVTPYGHFLHNPYGFHPLNEAGVSRAQLLAYAI